MNYSVLILEDHPLITEAYEVSLHKICKDLRIKLELYKMGSIDSFNAKLTDINFLSRLNLILLDIGLPQKGNSTFRNGEDIGIYLREHFPNIRILVSTSHSDNIRIINILNNLEPDVFLLKEDLNSGELNYALKKCISGGSFLSSKILGLVKSNMFSDLTLDTVDQKLLYELSIGTKMKDLPLFLNIGLTSVERRKRNLKLLFNCEGQSDRDLILNAKKTGFLN